MAKFKTIKEAEKAVGQGVKIEGVTFNKHHWAKGTKEEFMEANAEIFKSRVADAEDPETAATEMLNKAWEQIEKFKTKQGVNAPGQTGEAPAKGRSEEARASAPGQTGEAPAKGKSGK